MRRHDLRDKVGARVGARQATIDETLFGFLFFPKLVSRSAICGFVVFNCRLRGEGLEGVEAELGALGELGRLRTCFELFILMVRFGPPFASTLCHNATFIAVTLARSGKTHRTSRPL
jgi:hypothetical protein